MSQVESKRKLYQEMAILFDSIENCKKTGNNTWIEKHSEKLESLLDYLPHGSGLDYTWKYDYKKSNTYRIVLNMSFHAMDQNGYYDRIIDFTVKIIPHFIFDFNMIITGNFGKYQDIKEYLYDIIDYALRQNVESIY